MLVRVAVSSIRVEKPVMIGTKIHEPGETIYIGNEPGQIPEDGAVRLMKTGHIIPILPLAYEKPS